MIFSNDFFTKLEQYCQDGYIRKSNHPRLPLTIYNYTAKTTFEEKWDDITLNTRGLVLGFNIQKNQDELVIQGPKKFFNRGENSFTPKLDLTKSIISEKLDGYYISIKKTKPYGLIVSSRGSFDNKYTISAEKLITSDIRGQLRENYQYFCELLQTFEEDAGIIVTKYEKPRLVCWAMRDDSGKEVIPTKENCPFEVAEKMTFEQAKQYLTKQVEGVVAYDPKNEDRIKIKTDWFLETHRIISDCTRRRVWELNKSGQKVEDLDIPNEFMEQMLDWQKELKQSVDKELSRIVRLYRETTNLSDKDLALSEIPADDKVQLFNYRKNRNDKLMDKIYLKFKG